MTGSTPPRMPTTHSSTSDATVTSNSAVRGSLASGGESPPFDPATVTRPDVRLLRYYQIVSALTLVLFPITFLPLYLRYRTLRYRFDDEGLGMSVGLLFKSETYLTYRRIQDIHVSRGVIQRWLGLATVAIQTAAGSASAEMTIEGVADPDGLRDWLYARMRGVSTGTPAGMPSQRSPHATSRLPASTHLSTKEDSITAGGSASEPAGAPESQLFAARLDVAGDDEVLALLHDIRDELRSLRVTRSVGGRDLASETVRRSIVEAVAPPHEESKGTQS